MGTHGDGKFHSSGWKSASCFLLMSVTGPCPWETFPCCVLWAVLRFGNTLCKHAKSLQSCPTLCDPTDCSLPGSSVHGILQAGILEWVAVPSMRGFSQPMDRTQVSCIVGRFLTTWGTREAPRILEWVAYPFSRESSPPRNRAKVSCTAGRFFTSWATR